MKRGPLDRFFQGQKTLETDSGKSDFNVKKSRIQSQNLQKLLPDVDKENAKSLGTLVDELLVDLEPSWKKQLYPMLDQKTLENLAQFVLQERKRKVIFPPEPLVFNAFKKCPFNKVRVVIVGQDPYHGPGQAHGLCFSVPTGVKCPPSLENIFKELETDIPGYRRPAQGNLEHWSEQGVLLLNSVLTVEAHKPASHSNRGWEYFTNEVIKLLNVNCNGIIFLLWGKYAQQKGKDIDRKRHHVLIAAHPSPYSAANGWFGCRHFSKVNDILKSKQEVPINW
ncbi:Uracil-DNA glycosylase [Galdieria sulphuraria]|nr:Uracil-DNA glycosylase [Galdieria sulphuraria]